ncbi:MAG: peroxiredoxin [Cryobacterium sp.]|nr:peroxiredoxin [Oligoflexia bacterium]
MSIRIGMMAPEFKTKAYVGGDFKDVALKDYQGKWVCLFFYPMDFTFVCPTEILAFSELAPKFKEAGCEMLACSTDSHFVHKAWFERDLAAVKFPVLADSNHEISKAYGVLLENEGIALRGTFLIDPKGVLKHMSVNALDIGRSPDETLRTLQAAKTGELCPANWKPGQATLKT